MNILNKIQYIISDKRLIVLDSNNGVLSFDIIKLDGKTYINPEGKNLDTGKETVITVNYDYLDEDPYRLGINNE